MRVRAFEWDERNIDHIAEHGVNPEEVEEACHYARHILKGKEGRYLIYGQTADGRYLFVVGWYRGAGLMRTITARDMTDAEKRLIRKRR